jgi:nicotinamide-nucleotide amidase
LISHRITEVPGSSAYYAGGITAYSNELKIRLLNVKEELIQKYGAVSPQVAAAMAEGLRQLYGVDLALSSTGIAGPGGGTLEKPVGLVYLGLASADGTTTKEMRFLWNRSENKVASAQAALTLLWQHLREL